jgi:hypothetical protein
MGADLQCGWIISMQARNPVSTERSIKGLTVALPGLVPAELLIRIEDPAINFTVAKNSPANPLELTCRLPTLDLPVTFIVVMSFSFHAESISQFQCCLAYLMSSINPHDRA